MGRPLSMDLRERVVALIRAGRALWRERGVCGSLGGARETGTPATKQPPRQLQPRRMRQLPQECRICLNLT